MNVRTSPGDRVVLGLEELRVLDGELLVAGRPDERDQLADLEVVEWPGGCPSFDHTGMIELGLPQA